ncbi:MAG: DUF1854 domain-containing protein [Lachnospiraceae bacterium]|nr:DUF1854 domain-containing protein [Lachnospiraceae bacterium]
MAGDNHKPDLLDLHEFDEEALKAESAELLEMHFLTGDNALFYRTDGGFVGLKTKEKEYARVGVYLTFPLTNPEEFISIRESDEKAKEIGIVEKISNLPKDQQEMLREQIKLRYFMPVITKVLDIKDEYGFAYWNVITTFGACRFTTQVSRDAVINLTDSRLMVTDIDGNRYEIPDFYHLSVMERKKLDLFI